MHIPKILRNFAGGNGGKREGMKNRKVIMEKKANAFGKKSEEVYVSHAPGKAENIGYMKRMPPKWKGKSRPSRQNPAP